MLTMSGPPAVESFWAPDVDALAENLRAAGVRCDVVDEAYGRTLLVEHPDHPEPVEGEPELPGRRLWITETQTDTYGYTDHGHGVAHEAHPDQGRAARA